MKKKKLWVGIILIVVAALIGILSYVILTKEDKTTTLNILEKQWIESNKNQRFDFSIVTNIPIFSYEGEGIFLDFLDNIEEVTGLEFNRISQKLDKEFKSQYGFNIVDEVKNNDILIYEDNYVILSNTGIRYEDLSEIDGIVIGALNKEVSNISYYLKGADVTFKTCDEVDGLFKAIKTDSEVNVKPLVDAIVLPKTIYLDKILELEDFDISYNLTEMSKKFVLTLGDNSSLNNILTKYYEKWSSENFEKLYNKYLLDVYLDTTEVDEMQKTKFRSKQYTYGFVNNEPFDMKENGINGQIIDKFMKFANIEINPQSYYSYADLVNAINENKIDIMFNNVANTNYNIDVFNTVSIFDENFVILTNKNNNIVVNSINSLAHKDINVIKDTKIESYLSSQEFNVKGYKTLEEIINNSKNSELIVIDYYTYKYYLNDYFKDYDLKYNFSLKDDYNFIVRDISENKLLCELLDFYLSFQNEKQVINNNYNSIMVVDPIEEKDYKMLVIICSIVIGVLLIIIIVSKILGKGKKIHVGNKENKLKYIDMLTSLKNRNYLNDNIEAWDNSEVYPQTIIIADLNNVAYINDNYGHNEGDNLIKEAANILIKNQIANSEIMRTNGNEFLIYLVGYDEKQIISYIRKLSKEFKELAHGFGVALGYSMVNDAIKTIDDAINEATIEMRNNKEEANN